MDAQIQDEMTKLESLETQENQRQAASPSPHNRKFFLLHTCNKSRGSRLSIYSTQLMYRDLWVQILENPMVETVRLP